MEDLRYLLQVSAHHNIDLLPPEYTETLDFITLNSETMKEDIEIILTDLSLYQKKAKTGTVLEKVKRCLILSSELPRKINYNNFQIIPLDETNSSSADIYVDTIIFTGFEKEQYDYLKNILGIKTVKIIFGDIVVSNGYEPLCNYLNLTEFSFNPEFDITTRPILILFICIFIFMIIISPKLRRKM